MVQVQTYRAKRPEDAAKSLQVDARAMAGRGYDVVSQSWAEGRSGCLRVLFLGFIGALIWKPAGTLTVTYRLGPGIEPQPEPAAAPRLGDCSTDGSQYWNGEQWLPNS